MNGMTWMNEWEVRESQDWFAKDDHPNLYKGAQALERLMDWTNGCSDGWAYWQLPKKSADKLMEALQDARGHYRKTGDEPEDLTVAKLAALLRPVRALLRKQGVEETDSVLFPPPPTVYRKGLMLTRDQLEAWAGKTLSDEEVDTLDEAIPNSSIPEAIAEIVGGSGHDEDSHQYVESGSGFCARCDDMPGQGSHARRKEQDDDDGSSN